MEKMKGYSINSSMPEDIMSNIILQLPVKTLLRCKSVCKLWYKIIDDPKFAYIHSKKIKKSSGDNFLIEAYSFVSPTKYDMPFFDLEKSTDDSLYLTICNKMSRVSLYDGIVCAIVGSCNGLICLLDFRKNKLVIMNPLYSITDTYEVDFPNPAIPDRYVGFGFDESSHKFKIVCFGGRVLGGSHDYRSVRLLVHEVGVLSTSSWRELSKPVGSWFVHCLGHKSSSVFTDGCIHWPGDIYNEGTRYGSIVSFNLTTEELLIDPFDVEPLLSESSCSHRLLDFNGSLGVEDAQNGSVSILCRDAGNVVEDNKENTTKKWIKKFCIGSPCSHIVGILQARHILMMDKYGGYFSYNTQTGKSTQVPKLPRHTHYKRHQGSLIRPSSLASFCNSV